MKTTAAKDDFKENKVVEKQASMKEIKTP